MTKVEKTTKKKELRKQKSKNFELYRTNQISLFDLRMRNSFIDGEMLNY